MNIYLDRNDSLYLLLQEKKIIHLVFVLFMTFFWPPKEAVVLGYSLLLPILHLFFYPIGCHCAFFCFCFF